MQAKSTPAKLHVAVIHTDKVLEGETGPFYFASLDGEHYIGVGRQPEPGDEAEVDALLKGNGKFRPMTAAPRYLEYTAKQIWDGTIEFYLAEREG